MLAPGNHQRSNTQTSRNEVHYWLKNENHPPVSSASASSDDEFQCAGGTGGFVQWSKNERGSLSWSTWIRKPTHPTSLRAVCPRTPVSEATAREPFERSSDDTHPQTRSLPSVLVDGFDFHETLISFDRRGLGSDQRADEVLRHARRSPAQRTT